MKTSIELIREASRYFSEYFDVMREIEYLDGEMTNEISERYEKALEQYSKKPELMDEIIQKAGNIALVLKNVVEPEFVFAKKNKADAEKTRKRIAKKTEWLRAMAYTLLEATGEDFIKLNGKKILYFTRKQVVEVHNKPLMKAILLDLFNNGGCKGVKAYGGNEKTVAKVEYQTLMRFVESCMTVNWNVNFNREAVDVTYKINDKKAIDFLTSNFDVGLDSIYDIHIVEKKSMTVKKL